MSPGDLEKRIVNEIKARGYDDSYIDRNEQREIIQIAIELGGTLEGALAALTHVCGECNYLLESRLLKEIEEEIARVAGAGGALDRKGFAPGLAGVRRAALGKKNDRELKRLIVQVIEDGGGRVKSGWFSNWYSGLKREVGLA
jgi:hypothetical protein